jgi:para-nitrobenzyl esterase
VRISSTVALVATVLLCQQTAAAQSCVGDCNADGAVTVDEVVIGVNIALGTAPLADCSAFDRDANTSVDVAEVVTGITNLLDGCPTNDPRIVRTAAGLVRGTAANRVRSFLGVPYAEPPLGELRWSAPRPHPAWTGIRDATQAGASCPQTIPVINLKSGDEDCLFVNVHTPSPPPSTALPVMVWIHGGGFTSGDGLQFGGTDGSDVVRRSGVVVVSMNYRLGPLGFMAHRQLSRFYPNTSAATSGNYGFQDQIAALQWVQHNIAAFGGDPGNVTIFGESAGGWSVCLHLVAPQSAGLFQRAIVQSGICTAPLPTLGAMEEQGQRFAEKLGCGEGVRPPSVVCMRSKSVDDVQRALPPDPNFAFTAGDWGFWSPNVDGQLLPAQAAEMMSAGRINHVPVLIGSNKDEGTLFVTLAHDLAGMPLTAEHYADRLRYFLPTTAAVDAVLQQYPLDAFPTPGAALAASFGDAFLACPTIAAAALLAPQVPTFLYQFEYPNAPFAVPLPVPLGAFHSAEIQYVFGRRLGSAFSSVETTLSQRIIGYWTRFATAGDPNGVDATAWPQHGEAASYVVLDTEIATRQQPKAAACQFWKGLDYERPPLADPWEPRQQELEANRSKWASAGISSYRIRYRRGCFCAPPARVDIFVTDGQVVSIRDPESGEEVDPQTGPFGYNTIDGVFTLLADAIRRRAESFSVTYDPQLGYPLSVALDYEEGIADDELSIAIEEIQVLR